MAETDNQPDNLAARYIGLIAGIVLGGGLLLTVVGLGIVGKLLMLAGGALLVLGLVLFVVMRGLAMPAANALLTFLGFQSGSSTPLAKGYSHIEALTAQGRYQEAAAAYRREIASDSKDVEARIQLAQLLLKHLDDPAAAAICYREVRDLVPDEARTIGYSLRLVDLYRTRLAAPGRALVELRRLIDRFPESPQVVGARRELQDLLDEVQADPEAEDS
jgi:tetratricopeptide (TPR) repeat protein